MNKVITTTRAGGGTGKVESFTYYSNGLLQTKTDRNGDTTSYTYDSHSRLTLQTVGTISISYTYDNNGNVLTMIDGTGTTTYTYDNFNRVTSKTVPVFGQSIYEYDITANMDVGCTAQKITDPKGNITTNVFDRDGRLKQVIANSQTTVYNYYDNGSLQNVVYASGVREEYTYYDDNTLHTLINKNANGTTIDTYFYNYDNANNLAVKADSKGTTSYLYDKLNRLSTIIESNTKLTIYTYDAAGNRATVTISQIGTDTSTTTYGYDNQNRLTDTVTKVNNVTTKSVAYAYDNNGNQLTKTTTAYINGVPQAPIVDQTNTYDKLNQMTQTATSSGYTVINVYNGDGQRVQKTVNGTATNYLYDENDKVVLETNASNTQTAQNIYGLNLISRKVGVDTLYYLYNGHADVVELLDTSGTIVVTYYYDAFGNIIDQTGTANNNIMYAGYQYDPQTGLYYLNSRMYDPVTARFIQEDTYTGQNNDPLSLNRYTYCHNEPLRYSDPSGNYSVIDSTHVRVDSSADTLWKVASVYSGNGNNWTKIKYPRSKPEYVQKGDIYDNHQIISTIFRQKSVHTPSTNAHPLTLNITAKLYQYLSY